MAKIICGKTHAAAIRSEVKTKAAGKNCKLVAVLVGDNPASVVYIGMKEKACAEVGLGFELKKLPEEATQKEVLELIDSLNNDTSVTGVLVQQPFPPQLNKDEILSHLDPRKDVDCLHPYNVGLAATGQGRLLPCTPAGCVELLKREGIEISGKNAVIVGRSDIVGKPLSLLLLAENATVTICHSRTKNLAEECRRADILVAALGRPKFITADMVKPDAVIIDVGVNRLEGKKICGDVDYENCEKIASYITPVPGGVGPMTVATLMENCVKAWELQNG
ncbi:MAG: bifunctional 5,10-methylenetetrahydrofolate dehydrogenase/5,10-methenyltetrahydrofolate cyclohydrolase [Defluviitaleaceae bacterium]|nr:bifunctional 5,10-methylenetetrahydrofolate dehydrogenase/5,10-methenyltetrahydrofolate cyclohydrolase [Defluviitaleaceae bacterium]